jgi:hypothetical protein
MITFALREFDLKFGWMHPLSFHSPKTEVWPSEIHGLGLFATADIGKDEVALVKGGLLSKIGNVRNCKKKYAGHFSAYLAKKIARLQRVG